MSEGRRDTPIRIGPTNLEFVSLARINVLPQIRQEYDKDALEELANSILTGDLSLDAITDEQKAEVSSAAFDLENPLNMGRHDDLSLKRFIRDHGDYYQIPSAERVTPDSLIRLDDGRTMIANAGHRRRLASQVLAKAFEVDEEDFEIASSVYDNITFDDALMKQSRENVYDRPPAQDEAKAIGRLYRNMLRAHPEKPPTIAAVARKLGFRETKVRDALAFDSLPLRIQAYTFDGILSYGTVRKLKPLHEAYKRFYAQLPEDKALKSVEDDLVTFCNQMVNMDLSRNTEIKRAQMIENKCRELIGAAEYQQGILFVYDEATPHFRRETSARMLSDLAMKVLLSQLRHSDLSDEQMNNLQEMIEDARRAAAEREASMLDFFSEDNALA